MPLIFSKQTKCYYIKKRIEVSTDNFRANISKSGQPCQFRRHNKFRIAASCQILIHSMNVHKSKHKLCITRHSWQMSKYRSSLFKGTYSEQKRFTSLNLSGTYYEQTSSRPPAVLHLNNQIYIISLQQLSKLVLISLVNLHLDGVIYDSFIMSNINVTSGENNFEKLKNRKKYRVLCQLIYFNCLIMRNN